MIQLNQDQQKAIAAVEHFVFEDALNHALILKGSAGTGKTTLIKEIVKLIDRSTQRTENLHKRTVSIIAPTGRAARVLSEKLYPDHQANTIHRAIYALNRAEIFEDAIDKNDPGIRFHFPLKKESPNNTIFIVDESSMVGDSDNADDGNQFGSGRLLKDLLEFSRIARTGREAATNCKIIFVGDPAQLPPVGNGSLSPAMSCAYLAQNYGIQSLEIELKQVMRQAENSGILSVATQLRDDIIAKNFNRFEVKNTPDITKLTIQDALNTYLLTRTQKQTCVFISHSNAEVQSLNHTLRGLIWGQEGLPIQKNDILLVNRSTRLTNVEQCNASGDYEPYKDGTIPLTNGELIKVIDFDEATQKEVNVPIKGGYEKVTLSFRRVGILSKGSVHNELLYSSTLIIENLLDSKERELSALEQRALLVDFRQRHPELKPNTEFFTVALKDDPYFNAVQVKYGYAMTCHKAQGGEWDKAFVQFSNASQSEHFFRWAYTAMTRAKRHLITVGAPYFTAFNQAKWLAADELVTANSERPVLPATHPIVLAQATLPSPAITVSVDTTKQVSQADIDFMGQPKMLAHYFDALQEMLTRQDIQIEQVKHHSYLERYQISHNGVHAWFDYRYKGNFMVSTVTPTPSMPSDRELLEKVIPMIDATLKSTSVPQTQTAESPFINALLMKIHEALLNTPVTFVQHESKSYRLRVYFAQGNDRFQIDFIYNSKDRLTRSSEVGGIGKNQVWLQHIMTHLASTS